ncbi:hypothetical protein EWM64_g7399 [Hericium alpestre]|uniref:Tc1-like transposase DDE domain-containing protein n=1 Tax=Hericium alpestre TaxID=135208 RepID=A0A4Y9ZQT5_9AGAM|nr:hypothetical protein EWM64_g7399 [Hericium alpestre]
MRMAQIWMHHLGYRWKKSPRGQYVDGHKRDDVREYRDTVYLPKIAEADGCRRVWNRDGKEDEESRARRNPNEPVVVDHYHDETHFTANDRRDLRWVHDDEKPVPRAKTEGATLMVADFVSADCGWLCSPDGSLSARVLFKAGIARDGWFDNNDIIRQVTLAMDILDEFYPHERHRFIFDNATTHRKRSDDALSARNMSKKPTQAGKATWGVWRTKTGPDGKPIYGPNGKVVKEKIRMADARFSNGEPQSLYFPEGHPRAGVFKGMAQILIERGFNEQLINGLRTECKGFKCPPSSQWDPEHPCCCRRLLYNEPDFVSVPSILEMHCQARGYEVIFLPKFHCELNPIEQCWGRAKRYYRELPPSSKEADLERNALESLDSVPLESIRR